MCVYPDTIICVDSNGYRYEINCNLLADNILKLKNCDIHNLSDYIARYYIISMLCSICNIHTEYYENYGFCDNCTKV